jgi:hypothetical protein
MERCRMERCRLVRSRLELDRPGKMEIRTGPFGAPFFLLKFESLRAEPT